VPTKKPAKYQPGWTGPTRGGYSPETVAAGDTRNYGTYTGERCPKSGCPGMVVYNGNYFCEFWAWRPSEKYEEGECNWALPHPQTEYADKMVSFRLTGAWEFGEIEDPSDRHNTLWIEYKEEPVNPAGDSKAVQAKSEEPQQ